MFCRRWRCSQWRCLEIHGSVEFFDDAGFLKLGAYTINMMEGIMLASMVISTIAMVCTIVSHGIAKVSG
jgi:hypothetical protein